MQASGGGAGGAEGRDDQNSSRMRPSQSGSGRAQGEDGHRAPEGRGGPGRGREAMEAAVARPQGERAPGGLGPAGDVAPLAVRPRRGQLVLYPSHGASLGTVSGIWWWETCRQPGEGIEGSMWATRSSSIGHPGRNGSCQGPRSLEGGEDGPKG